MGKPLIFIALYWIIVRVIVLYFLLYNMILHKFNMGPFREWLSLHACMISLPIDWARLYELPHVFPQSYSIALSH